MWMPELPSWVTPRDWETGVICTRVKYFDHLRQAKHLGLYECVRHSRYCESSILQPIPGRQMGSGSRPRVHAGIAPGVRQSIPSRRRTQRSGLHTAFIEATGQEAVPLEIRGPCALAGSAHRCLP